MSRSAPDPRPRSTLPSPYVALREPYDEDTWASSTGARPRAHLREYWVVVRKHRWTIAASFLVAVVSAIVIVFTMVPKYTATARVQIERRNPKIAPVERVDQREDDSSYDQKYDYYQTRFKILQSRSTAARVIKALSLDSDERFLSSSSEGLTAVFEQFADRVLGRDSESEQLAARDELGLDPRLVDRYLRMLRVTPILTSRLVDVSFAATDRRLAAEIVNRHVEEYITVDVERRLELTNRAKDFLERELAKARDRVDGAEASLNVYRKAHQILSLDGGKSDIVSERLADLNKEYTSAQSDRIRLEGEYQLIKKRDYESLPDVVASNLITALKRSVAEAEAERAELEKTFTPEYPKLASALAREHQVKRRLHDEITNIVAGIESAYLAAKNREDSLQTQLGQQRTTALEQKDLAADYGTLSRDVETARDVYRNLLKRLKDVDVAEEIRLSDVSIVDPAMPPLRPSSPKKLLTIVLAAFGGLGGGVLLAFFLEYMDNTLRTPREVVDRLGLPALGVVPAFDSPALAYGAYGYGGSKKEALPPPGPAGHEGAALPAEVVISHHPRSIIAESYRMIRTKMLLSSADDRLQVVLFTSAVPREGKTVTAVNEALALVQTGARVLIIDADIRQPRVHRVLPTPNGHGLSTYLVGQSTLTDVIREVPLNGVPRSIADGTDVSHGRLFIMPAGPQPPNPAELLGSRRMKETLQQLRQDFDYIVIDTPPVLPATDAVVLAPLCDGVVYVVRGQHTPLAQVRQAQAELESSNARILGVVLNDVDVGSGDYYGDYRYQSYEAAEDAAP